MKTILSLLRIFVLAAVISFLIPLNISCGTDSANGLVKNNVKAADFSPLTVISVVGGNVLVSEKGASEWIEAKEGMTLSTGKRLKTDKDGTTTITFFDGSTIELNGDTIVTLDELVQQSPSSSKVIKLSQEIGETTSRVIKLVDPAARYEIETTAGVAAVRGSTMVVRVTEDDITTVYNVEGSISLTGQEQEVQIPAGSGSTVRTGEVPGDPQPGLPPEISPVNPNSISSQTGWQQTALELKAGEEFYVEYRGGSWSVDYRNFPYVGPEGYPDSIDKTIAAGYKVDSSVSYGFLVGKVGDGKTILIGSKGGPFRADVSGYLYLRINDLDLSLPDNSGSITVATRSGKQQADTGTKQTYLAIDDFSTVDGNPNGAWSYGWMPADLSQFNLYTNHDDSVFSDHNTGNLFMWYEGLGTDRTPCIWINNGDTAYGVPTGWLSLHPGPGEEASVLRWTAPAAGDVSVIGLFDPGDSGTMTVAVHHNSQEVWSKTDSGSFEITAHVAINDYIDFLVYGAYWSGNTPLKVIISYGG